MTFIDVLSNSCRVRLGFQQDKTFFRKLFLVNGKSVFERRRKVGIADPCRIQPDCQQGKHNDDRRNQRSHKRKDTIAVSRRQNDAPQARAQRIAQIECTLVERRCQVRSAAGLLNKSD